MQKNCKKTRWLTLEEPVREDVGDICKPFEREKYILKQSAGCCTDLLT